MLHKRPEHNSRQDEEGYLADGKSQGQQEARNKPRELAGIAQLAVRKAALRRGD